MSASFCCHCSLLASTDVFHRRLYAFDVFYRRPLSLFAECSLCHNSQSTVGFCRFLWLGTASTVSLRSVLYFSTLYFSTLYFSTLYFSTLYFSTLYFSMMYFSTLYFSMMYFHILFYSTTSVLSLLSVIGVCIVCILWPFAAHIF